MDANLPNRLQVFADDNRLENLRFFNSRIESAITSARQDNICSTLLLVCLNDFVKARQTLGTPLANRVVDEVSDFLKAAINKPYAACRLAENEFGILLYDVGSRDGIALAEFISSRLDIALKNNATGNTDVHASIGIATINTHARDADQLIQRARINTDSGAGQCVGKRSDDGRQAVDRKRIALLFQPILSLREYPRGGYEVLLRWRDKGGHILPPDDFLPRACLNNQAQVIDKAVLEKLLSSADFLDGKFRQLYVHISGHSMASPNLLSWLTSALEACGSPAENLVFQLREIDLYQNREAVLTFCRGLDKLGIAKAISGFGRALDPLPVLKAINPGCVRLESTLVRELLYSGRQQGHIRELVRDVHQQGVQVAVTGLEDIAILPLLWELGIDQVQGDCLHAPGKIPDFDFPEEQVISSPAATAL